MANSPQRDLRRFFTFKWIVFSILFFVIVAGSFWMMSRLDSKDRLEYNHLMSKFDRSKNQLQSPSYEAKQKKVNVQKDIAFFEKGQRLQFRLKAAQSDLIFEHKQENNQILEKMRKVHCYMQEALYYLLPDGREATMNDAGRLLLKEADPLDPNSWIESQHPGLIPMQQVRVLEAADADYYYQNDRFHAKEVTFSRYAIAGHEIIEEYSKGTLIMKGLADAIDFYFSEGALSFKAHGMQATFYTPSSQVRTE